MKYLLKKMLWAFNVNGPCVGKNGEHGFTDLEVKDIYANAPRLAYAFGPQLFER